MAARNRMECQFFFNIPTNQYNKLQGIQNEPMFSTLVQNTTIDNWGQDFHHNFPNNPYFWK
jgi:hypothetical protein